jgi:aspartate aminotransferase
MTDQPFTNQFIAMRQTLTRARADGATLWGRDFLDVGRSEPLTAYPSDDALAEPLASAAGATRRYPPVAGLLDIRARVANHYATALGVPLGPENVLLASGAQTALTLALATLCPPGTDVLLPRPYYHAHPVQVEFAGGLPRCADVTWRLTADAVANAGALLFANPANPTTTVYDAAALTSLLNALPPDAPIIADEVYAEYLYQPASFTSLAALLDESRDWLVVRGAAKTLGRPGLRIGVLIGPPRVIDAVEVRAAALTGAASLPAQLAFADGLDALAGAEHMRPYPRRRDEALRTSDRLGLTVYVPEGTYYLWLTGPGLGTVRAAAALARDAGVFAWPGEYFGATSHVRLSLNLPPAVIATALHRLAQHERRS